MSNKKRKNKDNMNNNPSEDIKSKKLKGESDIVCGDDEKMFDMYQVAYEKYTKEYGPKTVVWMQCGTFYEMYDYDGEDVGGKLQNNTHYIANNVLGIVVLLFFVAAFAGHACVFFRASAVGGATLFFNM